MPAATDQLEAGLKSYILSLPAVIALAGTRAYWGRLPEGVTYPAIRLSVITQTSQITSHQGDSGLGSVIVQVDAFAKEASGLDPYARSKDLARAVHGTATAPGLQGLRGPLGGSPALVTIAACWRVNTFDTYDPDELKVVRRLQAYDVAYYQD